MTEMLSVKQKQFLKDDFSRINLLYGSVRSGKTWISLLKWAIWIGQQPPKQEFLMVAKTLTALKRNCLVVLEKQIGDNISYSISQKKAVIFGRTVWLEGANDDRAEAKIRGMTLKGVYIDELSQVPEDFYLMALSRLSEQGAVCVATTNPDVPEHYVKQKIIDNENINKNVIKFLLDDNIFLDEEYKKNIIAEYSTMSKLYYQRFILGEFVRAEGLVFPYYADNVEKFNIKAENVPKHFEWVEIGFDIGGNGSAYALTCTGYTGGKIYVLKAQKKQAADLEMSDILQFVNSFCDYCVRKYGIYIQSLNCDHVAVIVNTINEQTKHRAGLCYKPPLEDRPFLMSKMFAEGRIFFVEDECEDLTDELQNLVFDEKSDKAIPLDDGTMQIDTWDSFIYSISGNWSYLDL